MKKLSATQIAVALATTHYGLGFLIGTGQDMAEYGAAGMLYAFSTALGLLTLVPIANYYWRRRVPIWDIFAKQHGAAAGKFTAFLSSFWMVGVIASQILGGSAALMAFGVSRVVSTTIIAGLILLLSYLNLSRLSKVFFQFLLISSIVVLFSLLMYSNVSALVTTPIVFITSLPSLPFDKLFGILLTTIFITFIGMDFHQFIVKAADPKTARHGAVGGFLILTALTSILGSSILGFQASEQPTPESPLSSAQVVPRMLMSTGTNLLGEWSALVFLVPIILVSAGSGSAVTKVVIKAAEEIQPAVRNVKAFNLIVIGACVLLTLLSQSIVGLVVSFYATYVGTVLAAFIAVRLEEKRLISISNQAFYLALLVGFGFSLIVFLISKLSFIIITDASLHMLIAGFLGATAIFVKSALSNRVVNVGDIRPTKRYKGAR